VLDQLSLLKMSPGGGAASPGIVLSQGPLLDLQAGASRAAVHRLPSPEQPSARMGTGGTLLQRLCTRLSSRFNSNFRLKAPFHAKFARLNQVLAPWSAKSSMKKA
jgi:hypothetical protein